MDKPQDNILDNNVKNDNKLGQMTDLTYIKKIPNAYEKQEGK